MKSKMAICIALSGWVLLAFYVFYDYRNLYDESIKNLFNTSDASQFLFRLMISSAPLVSTFLGYFVSKRTKMLKEVKASREKYLNFYQNAPVGCYFTDSHGTIIEVNDTWLKILGYERDEVIGRMKVTELLTDEDLKTFETIHSVPEEKDYTENLELDLRRKDGAFLPVIISARAILDNKGRFLQSMAIVRDNSEGKKHVTMLRRAAYEWRATFDSMPYGITLLDSEFNIIRANKYMAANWLVPLNNLSDKKCYEVVHREGRPIKDCPLLKSAKTLKAESSEFYSANLDKYFMANVNPIFDEEGLTTGYVHLLMDITDIKIKEKKLSDSRKAFFNMLRDMDSAYKELTGLYQSLIRAFANSIDAKSRWTRGHSERVANYAVAIANEMRLGKKDIEIIRTAALLHDIGKIGIYDAILDKPGKLTEQELALVKMHPAIGEEILRPISEYEPILSLIRSHHEMINGTGYPDGLQGEEIPLLARILCVADSVDAMTADRPYRMSPGREYAISELKRCSGTHFDEEIVKAFLRIWNKDGVKIL